MEQRFNGKHRSKYLIVRMVYHLKKHFLSHCTHWLRYTECVAVVPSHFFPVDFANSGASSARVSVSRNGEALPVTEKKLKDGLIVCTFTPKIPGVHAVDVMVDGILLPGEILIFF